MVAKSGLRAVEPGEGAPRAKSVAQAAAGGDHRDLLVAMRERIASAVSDPKCPPRDLASLTRRLQDIAKEIESIDMRARHDSDSRATHGAVDDAYDASAI